MRFPWTLQVWDELLTLNTALVILTVAPPECVGHAHLCAYVINAVIVCCIDMHNLQCT